MIHFQVEQTDGTSIAMQLSLPKDINEETMVDKRIILIMENGQEINGIFKGLDDDLVVIQSPTSTTKMGWNRKYLRSYLIED